MVTQRFFSERLWEYRDHSTD